MQAHTRIYIQALGLDPLDPIYSELSPGIVANDVHHIDARGMGGTKDPTKNSIFNLMALTSDEHTEYGDKQHHKEFLKTKHMNFLMLRGADILRLIK